MQEKYKRMIKGMVRKAGQRKQPREAWYLYILQCVDGSFYTGVTKDMENRLKKHNAGKASRYTRTRRPVKLIYHETCANRTRALVRECAVKSLSREKKEKLVVAK